MRDNGCSNTGPGGDFHPTHTRAVLMAFAIHSLPVVTRSCDPAGRNWSVLTTPHSRGGPRSYRGRVTPPLVGGSRSRSSSARNVHRQSLSPSLPMVPPGLRTALRAAHSPDNPMWQMSSSCGPTRTPFALTIYPPVHVAACTSTMGSPRLVPPGPHMANGVPPPRAF